MAQNNINITYIFTWRYYTFYLKGWFTLISKVHIFPLACSSVYPATLFWCELQRYWPQRCLPSLQYNGTKWHSACGVQSTKKLPWKIKNQCLFPKIMAFLLRIISWPCCEHVHVATTSLWQKESCCGRFCCRKKIVPTWNCLQQRSLDYLE